MKTQATKKYADMQKGKQRNTMNMKIHASKV